MVMTANEHAKRYRERNRTLLSKKAKEYYYQNHEKNKANHRDWVSRNREHCKEYARIYSASDRGKESQRDSYQRNIIKVKARTVVRDALRSGKLKRELCHCDKEAEAHHEDYNKPLEVEWLCKEHHGERTRERRCHMTK